MKAACITSAACLALAACGWQAGDIGAFKNSFRDQFAELPGLLGYHHARVIETIDEDRSANNAVLDLCFNRVHAVDVSGELRPLVVRENYVPDSSWRPESIPAGDDRIRLPWCAGRTTVKAFARVRQQPGAMMFYATGRTGTGTAADSSPMTVHGHLAFLDRETGTLHTVFWLADIGG